MIHPPSQYPKRRFWQLSLITAIVLMLTASGVMYFNYKLCVELPCEIFADAWPRIFVLLFMELFILFGVAYLTESQIRRTEARRQ